MTVAYQPSMFDIAEEPALDQLPGSITRIELSDGAWVDFRPGWLTGSDMVFEALQEMVPWRAERRQMYERQVDVPRLTCWYSDASLLPEPILADACRSLSAYYQPELGEPFRTAGLCLYRDGRDSVAWHGDTIGRGSTVDTMVAILSVGAERPLLLRPRGGGPARRFPVGHGDLVVMGGSCQRTWEHAVPKTAHPVGPRISIQYRPAGVA